MNRLSFLLKLADELDKSGDVGAADVIDSSITQKKDPITVKRWDEMSIQEKDSAWQLFQKSYEDAYQKEKQKAELEGREPNVVEPWDRNKFESRASNWTFFGNSQGYVSARFQFDRSNPEDSMYKLVGTAGEKGADGETNYKSIKSQLKGLLELQKTGKAVWGAVTENIKDFAVKYGFISPHPKAMKILKLLIPQESNFAKMISEINEDGSIQIDIDGDHSIKKFYIANDIYYKILIKNTLKNYNIAYEDEIGNLFIEFVKNGEYQNLMKLLMKIKSLKLMSLIFSR